MYKNDNDPCDTFTNAYRLVVDRHATLYSKKVRANHAPFITKGLSKCIMTKSKVKNKYLKWPSRRTFSGL